ncbi:MAG TPA: hypothetical protein VF577_06345, partial [Allosphingosinicella sp.]
DAFSRLARRPEALLTRAIEEAEMLASGPALQARCLECPPILRAQRRESLSLVRRILALAGM